ncbi:MAG: TonB-dependent receptor [Deltaproteobacteria bacterium]|nr:TonB-dependent receptor [Deltaproteobacteria bacterium]
MNLAHLAHGIVAATAALTWAPALWAQARQGSTQAPHDPDDDPAGVTVRADRLRRRAIEDRLYSATVVDLAQRGRTAPAVTALLDEAVGVHTRSTGDGLAPSFVSMRGAPTSQVTVALDGVVLNDAVSPTLDLSQLAPALLSRADIYRGPAPLRLGMQGMGGTIELHTRELSTRSLGWLSAGYGAFDQRRISALVSGRTASISSMVSVSYRGTSGTSRYFDDGATPFDLRDDRPDQIRRNAHADALDLLSRVCVSQVCLTGVASARTGGLPGPGSPSYARTYLTQGRGLLHLGSVLHRGPLRVAPHVSLQLRRDVYGDPARELGGTGALTAGLAPELGGTLSVQEGPTRVALVLRARLDDFATSNGGGGAGASRNARWSGLAGAELESQLGAWLLGAGVGVEAQSDQSYGGHTATQRMLLSPRVALRWSATPWLAVRAQAAVLERAPSLVELYGVGEYLRANPQLVQESSASVEGAVVASLRARPVHLRLELGGFVRHARDLIVLTRTSALALKALNLRGASIRGLEAQMRMTLTSRAEITASYAWTLATHQSFGASDGQRVPNVPEHDLFVRTALRAGAWSLESSFGYVAGLFFDSANLSPSPARALLGAAIHVDIHWIRGMSAALEASNLLDARSGEITVASTVTRAAIADFVGYPIASRSVYFSLSWDIDPAPSSPQQ